MKLPFEIPQEVLEDISITKALIKKNVSIEDLEDFPMAESLVISTGKLLRPVLHILFARLCGHAQHKHINSAAAIELIHNASLLHDDILDNATCRRGHPTYNHRYGTHPAVLGGDYLFVSAFNLLMEPCYQEILTTYINSVKTMIKGEFLQLKYKGDISITLEDYLEVISCKTASLMQAGIISGGQISGADNEQIDKLYKIGEIIGIIFQVIDDMMDYNLFEKITGKGTFNDFADGSVTFPLIYLLNECNQVERETTITKLGSPLSSECITHLEFLLEKYSVKENIITFLKEKQEQLFNILNTFEHNKFYFCIHDLVTFMLHRES